MNLNHKLVFILVCDQWRINFTGRASQADNSSSKGYTKWPAAGLFDELHARV